MCFQLVVSGSELCCTCLSELNADGYFSQGKTGGSALSCCVNLHENGPSLQVNDKIVERLRKKNEKLFNTQPSRDGFPFFSCCNHFLFIAISTA